MKQSDRELCERLTKALTTINKNYTPLAVSPASIEAIDENRESPGHIWLCVGGWAWRDFTHNRGGSGLTMSDAWQALIQSLESN